MYAWEMKKLGRADVTIKTYVDKIKTIAKRCNILDPEQVRTYIATANQKNNSKNALADIFNGFYQFNKIKWLAPIYQAEQPLPFIPTEKEIDEIISATSINISALLELLKETGCRTVEAIKLEWKDINTEQKAVNITGAKGSNSRTLPIKEKLIGMLNHLPKENNKVFQSTTGQLRRNWERQRKRIAQKLNNPRITQIHFHTLRHWKGTMEYHKTKDIIHVKTILGHKNIESTMIYINLEQALFLEQNDQWTVKVSHNITESTQLLEAGFEYITDQEGLKLYRKRK